MAKDKDNDIELLREATETIRSLLRTLSAGMLPLQLADYQTVLKKLDDADHARRNAACAEIEVD